MTGLPVRRARRVRVHLERMDESVEGYLGRQRHGMVVVDKPCVVARDGTRELESRSAWIPRGRVLFIEKL